MPSAKIIDIRGSGSTNVQYDFVWKDTGAPSGFRNNTVAVPANIASSDFELAIRNDCVDLINNNLSPSAALTLADVTMLVPEIPVSRVTGLATVATTGNYADLLGKPSAPTSYETIVSQTGTNAPAVSGGFTPVSTYAGGVTFTWARTSTGIYTLTASSAVFDTAGKTGAFFSPLSNLNASARAVVTSSTVITVTTAVQSVAVLGLLGLTAAATDGILDRTMIYIQTYA